MFAARNMRSAHASPVQRGVLLRRKHVPRDATNARAWGRVSPPPKNLGRFLSKSNALPGVQHPWSPVGETPGDVIAELASRVVAAAYFGNGDGEGRVFVGIAGCPGSGKSTLAQAVARKVNDAAGDDVCVVFPMDGFHYSLDELRNNKTLFPDSDEAIKRRGAPLTFDAAAFVGAVRAVSMEGKKSDIAVPGFSHETHDPEPGAIVIKPSHKIVLVEGNYLLLPEAPWRYLVEKNGALKTLLDETWWVDTSVDTAMARIEKRHVSVGRTKEEAKRRADSNDRLNGELVVTHKGRADVFVPSRDM